MYDTTKPLNSQIARLIKPTWRTQYVTVQDGHIRKWTLPKRTTIFPHIDGIGTKRMYHWAERSFAASAEDAFAMNWNDCLMERCRPCWLMDAISVPPDGGEAALAIVSHLVELAKKYEVAIVSGDTADDFTAQGCEITIAMAGFVRFKKNWLRIGDILIGLASSGLHANGLTRVREIFGNEFRNEFIAPTTIYGEEILELDALCAIHGMMHITGGAFARLKRILPKNANCYITRRHTIFPQQIFFELFQRGVPDDEMCKTFNCGIGFILGVQEEDVPTCLSRLRPYRAEVIGSVGPGRGRVEIESSFTNRIILY